MHGIVGAGVSRADFHAILDIELANVPLMKTDDEDSVQGASSSIQATIERNDDGGEQQR